MRWLAIAAMLAFASPVLAQHGEEHGDTHEHGAVEDHGADAHDGDAHGGDVHEAHAEEHGAHGHGEVSAGAIFSSIEFWGAVVNFGLLVFLLRRYASKPLAGFLQSRRAQMEVAIREAAEAKAAAESKLAEYEARLKTLDDELKTMRSDIEKAAREDKERILAEAEDASARLREETAALVRQSAAALEREVRREVVVAAVEVAERVLRETTSGDDQRRLADRYREGLTTGPRGSA